MRHLTSVQPPQSHQRPPVTDILNKPIPHTPSPTSLLPHNLRLSHHTFPFSLPARFLFFGFNPTPSSLLLTNRRPLPILNLRRKLDHCLSRQHFQILIRNVSRNITDAQPDETQMQTRILLQKCFTLLVTLLSHLDFALW
ncbi:hypothetical protein AA313_de0202331 [Arthrobotrys entomopaga]|nr:hypothetical protein AA313_de0202331 [Arthrobotrys entomopaga]